MIGDEKRGCSNRGGCLLRSPGRSATSFEPFAASSLDFSDWIRGWRPPCFERSLRIPSRCRRPLIRLFMAGYQAKPYDPDHGILPPKASRNGSTALRRPPQRAAARAAADHRGPTESPPARRLHGSLGSRGALADSGSWGVFVVWRCPVRKRVCAPKGQSPSVSPSWCPSLVPVLRAPLVRFAPLGGDCLGAGIIN